MVANTFVHFILSIFMYSQWQNYLDRNSVNESRKSYCPNTFAIACICGFQHIRCCVCIVNVIYDVL